jgi:redox-sensitive bicupin YhaK (pirin superfamily)
MSEAAASLKRVASRVAHSFSEDIPGLPSVNLAASAYDIEPILVFTEFHMDRPIFGPHPHAGVSVMTYLLPDSAGSFLNRDSLGDRSEIPPGGLHITQAGRGMHHDEVPLVTGVDAHGFQIWINHRESDRWVEPRAMHAMAHEVPEVREAGAAVRVVHGAYAGRSTPYRMVTDVTLLHVRLDAGASITVPAAEMAFAYGVKGTAAADGAALGPQVLLVYGADGDTCRFEAGSERAEFMYVTATPLREPIVYGGPFVMTTSEQMRETQRRYARGEMGRLGANG